MTIQHRSKLFGGRTTAEELHSQSMRAMCPCGAAPRVKARVFVPVLEVLAKCPEFVHAFFVEHPEMIEHGLPVVQFTDGAKWMKVDERVACAKCLPQMERDLAHGAGILCGQKLHAEVQFDRGPGTDPVSVQIPAGL